MTEIFHWIWTHFIEVFGALTGLIYIYFSIKEKIWLWPTGIITSAIYIYVFFISKFYADMSLQIYYLIISIYGWIYWKKGSKKEKLPIIHTPLKIALILSVITFILFWIMAFVLKNYTDSPVPYWDAFTTALSITATYMLARKYIEQWLLWIIVDSVSACLYFYKQLYATVILFIVYTILAIAGFLQWKKIMKTQTNTI